VSAKHISSEVIVVDNNSVDGSVEMIKNNFPNTIIINNKKNVGFSKANNQAIKIAKGDIVLMLNPDTVIQEKTLKYVLNFINVTNNVGAVGIKMVDGKGNFLPESKRSLPKPSTAFYKIFGLSKVFPNSKKFGKYHLNFLDKDKIHEIDVISGAFLMTKKSVLEEVGFLDERFFMYGEDIDLSYRIQKKGYINYYLPDHSIIHYKGESTKKTSVNYIFTFYNAMILFVKKHYDKKDASILISVIKLAIMFRALISVTKRFITKLTLPIIDAVTFFLGIVLIKSFWATNYFSNENYYNDLFLKIGIPSYIFFWMFGIYMKKGYNNPIKISRIIIGILSGTILLLIIYGLLPENLRFSRALIIFGTFWAILSSIITRYLISSLKLDSFKIHNSKSKRIAIAANKTEFDRIIGIIKNNSFRQNIFFQISKLADKTNNDKIGTLEQVEEILKIYKIDELIFSAKDYKSNEIISTMQKLNNRVEIKIAPTKSTFVIGSNSIHSKGELYSIQAPKIKNNFIISYFKKILDFFN
tara:strand:- start:1878 stop:3458 length:1581 start_codon:yes stop_codon:yes gene_type:complete